MKKACLLVEYLFEIFCRVPENKVLHTYTEYQHPSNHAKLSIIMSLVLSLLFMVVSGCGQKEQRGLFGKSTKITQQYSKQELRESLNNFDEFAMETTSEAARQIDEKEPDFRARKLNLIQRTQIRRAFNTMLEQEDPVIAFIETWTMCTRLVNYLKDGEGSDLFRQHQHIVITAFEKLKTVIEKIGRKFLKEDVFAKTQRNIYSFAKANPITGTYSNIIVYATEVKPGQSALFSEVLSIPMSPFKAIGSVDRTALAIHGVKESANRFSDVVEEFPESARWQLLLLLMEIQETEMVESVLKSMTKFSDSSVRFADSTEKLPQQLREQLSILIQDIDEKQSNLQATLDKAEKTAVAVERSLEKADEVAVSFGRTVNDVNEAATAWDKAAAATSQTLQEFAKLKPAKKEPSSKAPFNINDYRDTAEAVAVTAKELSTLMAEFREFVRSDDLDGSSFAAQKWTNHLTWRILQIVLIIFVLAIVYRIVAVRIIDNRK
ncbi:MAG: hypothetical protein GY774_25715 [Planctomycetes bacterium]|nr:hypothetical protein [Planctomycetota bacterium]